MTDVHTYADISNDGNNKTPMDRLGARILLICSFVFLIVMNFLASTGIMNGTTVSKVGAEFTTRITPAPYAFSIWGLIWSFVTLFVIYFTFKTSALDSLPNRALIAFAVNCVSCGLWCTLFCYKLIFIAFIDIVIVALSTAYLYTIFYPGTTSAFPQCNWSYWCRGVAWSIQLGWISVASLINLYMVFIKLNIFTSVSDQNAISVMFLAFAGLIGLIIIVRHEDILTTGVLLWALVAIAIRHGDNDVVYSTTLAVGGVCLGLMLYPIVKRVTGGRSEVGYTDLTSIKHVEMHS